MIFNTSLTVFPISLQYLHSLRSYTDRNEVCTEIVEYLCSIQTNGDLDPTVSHHILEVMLYKANLSIIAGQLQYAKNILQVCWEHMVSFMFKSIEFYGLAMSDCFVGL